MCTPQLKAQVAAGQGAPSSNPTAPYGGGGSSNTPGAPLPSAAMSVAALSRGGYMASRLPPNVGAGVSPLITAASQAGINPSSVGIPGARRNAVGALGSGAGLSVVEHLIGNQENQGAKPDARLAPGRVVQPSIAPTWDEVHAPTPQTIGEALAKIQHGDRDYYDPAIPDARRPLYNGKVSYLTSPQGRAFLADVERMMRPGAPYPDGNKSSGTSRLRSAYRILVGYLYTMPEMKAFLDVFSHTEGTEKYGYLTANGSRKLQNLLGFPAQPNHPDRHQGGPQGRYQLEGGTYDGSGRDRFARSDFSEVTQDLTAIAALVAAGATDKLMEGDLLGALSRASKVFASVPMNARQDHSGYYRSGKSNVFLGNNTPPSGAHFQPTHVRFDDLPQIFAARLNSRREEFRNARSAWESAQGPEKRPMPWAFISPLRWHLFGNRSYIDGAVPSRQVDGR